MTPFRSEVTASYLVPGPERQLAFWVKYALGTLEVTVNVILGVKVDDAIAVNVPVGIFVAPVLGIINDGAVGVEGLLGVNEYIALSVRVGVSGGFKVLL